MKWAVACLALFASAHAQAQQFGPVSGGAVTSDQLAAVAAAIPPKCTTTPWPDTLIGSVGTAAPCTPPADATRPTIVQAGTATTDAGGNWSITWAQPFVAAPFIYVTPINTGGQPVICNVATSTGTGATGVCWVTFATTLPGLLTGILNLVINPTQVAASIPVRIAGRQATQ